MAGKAKKEGKTAELTMEQKLKYLYDLQAVDAEINKFELLRGELPLEVQDLEDELTGLTTRIENLQSEVKELDAAVATKRNDIVGAQALIKKYEEQQNNVRNNREYDSLSKEIEFQTLEIQLCEKRIREFSEQADKKNVIIADSQQILEERTGDLNQKKAELDSIVSETELEEDKLKSKIDEIEKNVDDRYLQAYKRIKSNARNGLAVVTVQRDACGGCYNKIPPQRQVDIRARKRIIVCEYCGRILVDAGFGEN
ncbi:MAG: C4-type zinc ribbon domain-containing protein [Salinivirgaceae bacterium]|jgi:predicted  nucleic acid-binding Zn-ribbon protein|nr:C4-type zinc ribbon domain-containing protein [Salinivirgaceae bacterium]